MKIVCYTEEQYVKTYLKILQYYYEETIVVSSFNDVLQFYKTSRSEWILILDNKQVIINGDYSFLIPILIDIPVISSIDVDYIVGGFTPKKLFCIKRPFTFEELNTKIKLVLKTSHNSIKLSEKYLSPNVNHFFKYPLL